MEHRRITQTILLLLLLLTISVNGRAQGENRTFWSLPWHVEAGLTTGTSKDGLMPFGATVDLNYTFGKSFSIHAVSEATYFHPKKGMTSDYNKAFNLGGGIGYAFSPATENCSSVFEARASVTASVGSSDFKNTAYQIGLYWYRGTDNRKVVPVVGVGYSARDFSQKALPTYHGAFLSFGLRF